MSLSHASDASLARTAARSDVMAASTKAWQRIRAAHPDVRSLGVTSSLPREGRSTVAQALALANARALRTTVLVDLDCVAPARRFADATGDELFESQIHWVSETLGTVTLEGAGHQDHGFLDPRVGPTLQHLLDQDVEIIADLPAMPPSGAGDRMVGLFELALLVVRAGRTPTASIRGALTSFPDPPAVMLNGTHSSIPSWFPFSGGR